ncbi:MAG: bifunctional diguanylate cyclase/phosphodiesterase [Actinomycetota bacterium]|nr:bifunctional diguanylate cyclase/phosphodiesterase [Actinomycetota bacterium]
MTCRLFGDVVPASTGRGEVVATARWYRPTRPLAWVRLTVAPVFSLTVAALVVILCPARLGTSALVVGLLTAGLAVTGGAEVLRRGWGSTGSAVFRRWLGAAMVAWGIGEFARGVVLVTGAGPPFAGVGDLASVVALGLTVAGVLTLPRPADGSHPVARIILDSGLLSVVLGLLMWRLAFVRPSAPAMDAARAADTLGLLAEIALCSIFVVTALRDLEVHLVLVAGAIVGFVLGDMGIFFLEDHGSIAPTTPLGQVPWLLAWPMIAWALLHFDPGARTGDDSASIEIDPDARVTVVTTITSLLLLGAGTGTIILQAPAMPEPLGADAVSWVLVVAAVGLLSVRELLNARMRTRLLGRLHEEAMSDPLTGLANRRMLSNRLADVQPGELWCLIAIDLDSFKGVNDLLGHAVGDQLLCAVGSRFVRNLPRAAIVSRTGGDEFAVLLPGGLPEGVAAAEIVLAAVRRSCWDVEGVTRLPVTASVGVTLVGGPHPVVPPGSPDEGDPLSALSEAGAALQLAKAAGRDRLEVFDGAAALMRQRRLSVEERLRAAIRAGDIDVQFQPVVNLRTGAISSVEALARWVDPRLGRINPQEFIPVAEQTGLVVGLGELVLHRTLDMATQHGLPERGIRVACNVSPLQLRVPGFPQIVEDALAAYAMPPGLLLVEVTEAVLVEEDGPGVQALRRLADVGVTIAIDDFGTGYSALGYLRRLPAHALKIDRSLTSVLVDEPQARAITRAVIDLGSSLDMAIIVEGIETSDVAELVTSMGAGYGQGTLYGSAMPMADIVRLSRRPLSRSKPA